MQTQFGVHIIRLDGIREKSYKPFEEVKETIVAEMRAEYQRLALKDYVAQFNMTDEATVDMDAVNAVLAGKPESE